MKFTIISILLTVLCFLSCNSFTMSEMRINTVKTAKITYPTGDPKFSVFQAFPAGLNEIEADPFLMCDQFGPSLSKGVATDPDAFDVRWHPHRGMDILTYLTEGVGRHADSLGNRGTYRTPGMQWISVGSGIEHAEGGGTPAGQYTTGFQIWVNVPSSEKMNDPRYGTEPPENIPVVTAQGMHARLLAGEMNGSKGPFKTTQRVQIVDFEVNPGASYVHTLDASLNNAIAYVYKGSGSVAGQKVPVHSVVHLDATDASKRSFTMSGGAEGLYVMLFAGQRLNQPIAWHGPFVMTTQAEIDQCLDEYRRGTFLKKRAAWDYKRIATAPPGTFDDDGNNNEGHGHQQARREL